MKLDSSLHSSEATNVRTRFCFGLLERCNAICWVSFIERVAGLVFCGRLYCKKGTVINFLWKSARFYWEQTRKFILCERVWLLFVLLGVDDLIATEHILIIYKS